MKVLVQKTMSYWMLKDALLEWVMEGSNPSGATMSIL